MTASQFAVLAILDNAEAFEWSIQGFGMLRLYIRKIGRIHVWDSALRYPGVSMIHNHSWDLASEIVFGEITNRKYFEIPGYTPVMKQRLVTGYQHSWVEPPVETSIAVFSRETYGPGQKYAQLANEIHLTDAVDGTVTVMARNDDVRGEADVYWPVGTAWGTAQPRPATKEEVRACIDRTLERLAL